MIAFALADEIRFELENGLSQRKVAKKLKCSRATVYDVFTGKWHAAAAARGHTLENDGLPPPIFCQRCRFHVYPPCIKCNTLDWIASQDRPKRPKKAVA